MFPLLQKLTKTSLHICCLCGKDVAIMVVFNIEMTRGTIYILLARYWSCGVSSNFFRSSFFTMDLINFERFENFVRILKCANLDLRRILSCRHT